jgi:retron-type reverse transcriptase
MGELYEDLRKRKTLRAAWRHVHANGRESLSKETQDEVRAFAADADARLERIARRLYSRKYRFSKARGLALRREGKAPRPIVRSCVEDRIVQRALLSVLQKQPFIREYLDTATSFGTGETRTARHAIAAALAAMSSGARYVARSDIRDFFTRVPRAQVLDSLSTRIGDAEFCAMLGAGTLVELENAAALGAIAEMFPSPELGVAQGSSLSSLFGNVFLAEFDKITNSGGVVCLRYVDDFLLLGPDACSVRRAFEQAERWLGARGLQVHALGSSKAHQGPASAGFDFLGCTLRPGLVSPSRSARRDFRARISSILSDSLAALDRPNECEPQRKTVSRALYDVGNVTRAWGCAYSFCNDGNTFHGLDEGLTADVISYLAGVQSRVRRLPRPDQRRVLGVPLLTEMMDAAPRWRCKAGTRGVSMGSCRG